MGFGAGMTVCGSVVLLRLGEVVRMVDLLDLVKVRAALVEVTDDDEDMIDEDVIMEVDTMDVVFVEVVVVLEDHVVFKVELANDVRNIEEELRLEDAIEKAVEEFELIVEVSIVVGHESRFWLLSFQSSVCGLDTASTQTS